MRTHVLTSVAILATLPAPAEDDVLARIREEGFQRSQVKVGSRRYVEEHFGPNVATAGGEALSVYFNVDNGTGQFRGAYLHGNERVRDLFAGWMAPLRDLKMDTLTIDHTFGIDVEGFDMAGLPAFQFIQDVVDYDTRTHHSNMDVYDRLVPEDMRKNAVILATFLYYAAMSDERVPREEN